MPDEPSPTNRKPTRQELRDRCKTLGITPASCGMATGELIALAAEQPDPLAWLATYSNAPPHDDAVDSGRGPVVSEEANDNELGQASDPTPDHRPPATNAPAIVDPLKPTASPGPATMSAALGFLPACSKLIDRLAANLGIADTSAMEMSVELLGQVRILDIELPLCLERPPSGQVAGWEKFSQKIEVGSLTARQMTAFWSLHEALDRGQFRTAGGEKIDRSRGQRPKVIRWLLDQVADAIEAARTEDGL